MQRFFVDDALVVKLDYTLPHRIHYQLSRVLRYQVGQELILVDRNQRVYLAEFNHETVHIKAVIPQKTIEKPTITLVLGMLKKDKWDYALQKSTELGVDVIVPLITQRSIARWDDERNKRQRYELILQEAAEQSERISIPILKPPIKLNAIHPHLSSINIVAYERNQTLGLKDVLKPTPSITIVIGSEGGLTQDELDFLLNLGFNGVSLGPRILRSETAASYALSVLSSVYETLT